MMREDFRFKRLVLGLAFGLAIAAFSAPAVQAKPTSGNGPLDPWAYGLIHRSTQANATPAARYGPPRSVGLLRHPPQLVGERSTP